MPPRTRSRLDAAVETLAWIAIVTDVASFAWFAYNLLFDTGASPALRNSWLMGCVIGLLVLGALVVVLRQRRKR